MGVGGDFSIQVVKKLYKDGMWGEGGLFCIQVAKKRNNTRMVCGGGVTNNIK